MVPNRPFTTYIFSFDSLHIFIVLAWMTSFRPGEIGLLLRGNQLITNGLQLLELQDVENAGRLSSSNNNTITDDQNC